LFSFDSRMEPTAHLMLLAVIQNMVALACVEHIIVGYKSRFRSRKLTYKKAMYSFLTKHYS
jgi:hypothetical protein